MGFLERLLRQSGEAAAKAAPPPKVLDGLRPPPSRTFVTERAGSQYVINDDGTTVRTKAATEWHPDHQDAGPKAASASTFYLQPDAASVASRGYASGRSPISGQPLTRLVARDGKPVMLRMQFEREPPVPGSNLPGKPIRELGYAEVPIETAAGPEVGLSPLEFFEDGGFHLGSKITEIR
jgi:hypothetical protein